MFVVCPFMISCNWPSCAWLALYWILCPDAFLFWFGIFTSCNIPPTCIQLQCSSCVVGSCLFWYLAAVVFFMLLVVMFVRADAVLFRLLCDVSLSLVVLLCLFVVLLSSLRVSEFGAFLVCYLAVSFFFCWCCGK